MSFVARELGAEIQEIIDEAVRRTVELRDKGKSDTDIAEWCES